MKQPDPETIQAAVEKKAHTRAKKKKPAMNISGRSVKELQRLIIRRKKRH